MNGTYLPYIDCPIIVHLFHNLNVDEDRLRKMFQIKVVADQMRHIS